MKLRTLTRRLSLSALLLGVLHLAGCGSNNATNSTTSDGNTAHGNTAGGTASPQSDMKVALLTPGDINDQGWNQLANDGLKEVQKETGAQTKHQWTQTAADHKPALRDFANQKFDVVICHGFEYGERVKAIAPKYPDTKFVVVAGDVKQDPNVATIVPKLEEATYLLGMAAGGMTKSNVIGAIGGMKLPVIASTFKAFEDGAKAVNPKVRVLINYVGNFEDQNKAKESAKAMITQGADVLLHNADQAW
jgi:basic membrane protein A